jgi:type IV fimbrial biogenesis protein FimT
LNKDHHLESGASLLELMAVVLILAISATITMPLLQEQITIREIESVARRFIAHAQFARQQALHLGEPVKIEPLSNRSWEDGWSIKSGCIGRSPKSTCVDKTWISHGKTDPIFFKGGARHFIDPHTSKIGILFNAAGAAKTAQGGFVANRLILGHQRVSGLERQLILGSGGRWRICDPTRDAKRCH